MIAVPSKPLREVMLDVHEKRLKKIHGLSSTDSLSYDDTSTRICINSVPIYSYLARNLHDPSYLEMLSSLRKETRNKLLDGHRHWKECGAELLVDLQFDYEMLALDHLVDVDRVRSLEDSIDCEYARKAAPRLLLSPS